MPTAKVERETGDLTPSLMLDCFSTVKAAVLAGDAIGLAPLTAIETELRTGKVALVPFDAPWLHLSYGLFYPRKRTLSRAAQLFVTQLRQVETDIQTREHKALARMDLKRRPARKTAKSRATSSPATGKRRRTPPRSRK